MKKLITTTIAAGLVAGVAFAEVSTTFDFASAYVFRGVTYNNGAVFQPGIEASGFALPEEYGSLTVGAWGNYDIADYDNNLEGSEFSEVDWYGSYSFPTFVEGLDIFVGYCEYTYPGAVGDAEIVIENGETNAVGSAVGADKEANIGVGYEISGVAVGFTTYFNVGGGGADSAYCELTAGYGFDIAEGLSASIDASAGYIIQSSDRDAWNDGTIGASLSYAVTDVWSIGASLTYIAQLDDEMLADAQYDSTGMLTSGNGYDVEMVGMLSIGASF